jgi:hypothetical protein
MTPLIYCQNIDTIVKITYTTDGNSCSWFGTGFHALHLGARCGCDRMVVGFITIYAISAYHLPLT